MFFYRMVLAYLLGLSGYIAYILHTSTTDKIQAGNLLLAGFANMIIGIITAFLSLEKVEKAKNADNEEQLNDTDT